MIEALTGQKWSKFYSKEYSAAGYHPYLTIYYSCVGVEQGEAVPGFGLTVSNPSRDRATIRYALPETGPVSIEIYDIRGRLIARPVDGILSAGSHALLWGGRDGAGGSLAAGVYFCRLRAENRVETKRMILLR